MQTIAERLESARTQIKDASTKAGRNANCVKLLAVSKKKPVSDITQAYACGQRLFGENYVQEGVEKIHALANLPDIEWHMIGPLQSNKTRLVAENFAWVHTIDRLKIAQRLNDQRPSSLPPLNVCIQLNLDDEASKAGIQADQIDALYQQLVTLPNLCVRGFMAIPDPTRNDDQRLQTLAQLQQLFEQYRTSSANFDTLSVGMSGDLDDAIAHGSTMVRIGTAIFGQR